MGGRETNLKPGRPIYISFAGPALLDTPLLNKGSAFSRQERETFNLLGLLPPRYESLEEQANRAYMQYCGIDKLLDRHIYLRFLQDSNETLFYRLLTDHLPEMLPIIYTPIVGEACERFSDIYRNARGIFVSYDEREYIEDILRSATKDKVKVIVVTDGERVLGLGDQGIGGMGISIGKLALYTACGGISPAYTLAITLDVGTNNQSLLKDPYYMGLRRARIAKPEYDAFVDEFIAAAQQRWPGVLIQFEDFAQPNAMPILQRHRHQVCCFNDDIQGTAAVTLGSLLSACRKKDEMLSNQRVVIAGAGSAGCGIAELIVSAMVAEGLSDPQARARIFMVDRFGLLTTGMPGLLDFQQRLAQPIDAIQTWKLTDAGDSPGLLDVVSQSKASILIGVSGQAGLFSADLIRKMNAACRKPIIFPLSNPSRHVEALPKDLIRWTNGDAIIATGSPFSDVEHQAQTYEISQCNNSYVFPGIGLGVVASKAKLVSDEMLMAASTTLALMSADTRYESSAILPPLNALPEVSRQIAFAVAKTAQSQGLAQLTTDEELAAAIDRSFWTPAYRDYRRIAARAN